MKKILSFLGTITLVSMTGASVVACNKTPVDEVIDEAQDPIIESIENKTIKVGKQIEFKITIKNRIENEKISFKIDDSSLLSFDYNEETEIATLKAIKAGRTKIILEYKNAKSISFDVNISEEEQKPLQKIQLDDLQGYLGYLKNFSEKTTINDLTEIDKKELLKNLLISNNINDNLDIYIADIEMITFKTKNNINRYFGIKSKQNSEIIAGNKDDIFFRTETLNFNKYNLSTKGTNIEDDLLSENEKENEIAVKNAILNLFIRVNKEEHPISIKDIDIEAGSAKNGYEVTSNYEVVIFSKEGQENNSGKLTFQFQTFYLGGKIIEVDIKKLFNK
ncbi:lipoprotein [Spiroplasma endosymbiont of Diplazon laetatorius]|uniref:lipoprotein n=1 Tax=Spiroplasma endosymbiont of Diplazon laetatorius TaxID=3066322 RepID=UPI0030CE110D